MEDRIREDIQRKLDLSPNDFKLFLEQIAKIPVSIKVLAQLMKQAYSICNKNTLQKLATSINFIIEYNFKSVDKNPQLWNLYYNHIAIDNQIQWKIAKIFQRSITTFMESFQGEFDSVMTEAYPRFSNSHRIMAANAIVNGCQFIPDTRFTFIQKSFSEYLKLGDQILLQIIDNLDNKAQDILLNFLGDQAIEYLLTLKQTLYFLKINSNPATRWQQLLNQISVDEKLIEILSTIINLKYDKKDKIVCLDGSIRKQQIFNNFKAVALQCYLQLLRRYHRRSTIQQFDTFPVLQFMENKMPKIVQQLQNTPSKYLWLDCNSVLCISMLKFINKACGFIFMNNYFYQNYRRIFWKVIYPLLRISGEEIREFSDDSEGFIRQAESLIQQIEDSESSIKNIKTYASILLQSFCENIDGALTYITNQIFISIENILLDEELSSEGHHLYSQKIQLQSCLTIISSLASKINLRSDLLENAQKLINNKKQNFLKLQGIDLARLFIYLQYTYQNIFTNEEYGKEFFYVAADCLQQKNQTLMRCALNFFKQYKHLDVSGIVWDRLISLISQTQYSELLGLIAQIVRMRSQNFQTRILMDILKNSIKRLSKQFEQQIQNKKKKEHHQLTDKSTTLQCLKIIKYIAQITKNHQDSKQIITQIWNILVFIKDFSIIQADDEIIQIYLILMQNQQSELPSCYFDYFDDFRKYHIKQKAVGTLYEVYVTMVETSPLYFQSDQGRQSLDKIIVNLLTVIDFCVESTLCQALILMQYFMYNFSKQINHQQLFDRTFQAYQSLIGKTATIIIQQATDKIRQKHKKISAYFISLWMLGSINHEDIYHIGIDLAIKSDPSIFNGFICKIIGLAIRMKIQILSKNGDIQKIIDLLKFGLRILDSRNNNKQWVPKKSQNRLLIFKQKDMNQQIKQCFTICKYQLRKEDYDNVVKEIDNEISMNNVKQLLSSYNINSENRRIIKIAAKN